MSDFNDLKPLFGDDKLDPNINHEQIKVFYDIYKTDFVDTPLIINGKQIKIISKIPIVAQYKEYQETFYHIITRKSNIAKMRLYECNRANRIHWIKPILLNHPHKDILYYKWKDEDGICKEHYWLISKSFMVVLKNVDPDKQIVTSFCVDADEKLKYFERYDNFRNGVTDCPKEKTHPVGASDK
jgi:hypothetical protein